jgi:hypothetical protein
MTISLRKGELIKRHDAKLQLGFCLTGLRQRLMSFASALPPRLVGQTEHAIGRIIDEEVRSALKDIASWPERMANPGWCKEIDEDLRPPSEAGGNGDGEVEGAVKRERANAKRRAKYAKAKEVPAFLPFIRRFKHAENVFHIFMSASTLRRPLRRRPL